MSDPYAGAKAILYLLDGIWIIMVISLAGGEDKWNYLDWLQIVLALTVQFMWFKIYIQTLIEVTTPISTAYDDNVTVTEADYNDIYRQLDSSLSEADTYRVL